MGSRIRVEVEDFEAAPVAFAVADERFELDPDLLAVLAEDDFQREPLDG